MEKDKEEREAQDAIKEDLVSRTTSIKNRSGLDKRKGPMGEVPQTSVEQ